MTREELLLSPHYHLTTLQCDMYRVVKEYIEASGKTEREVAHVTGVSLREIRSILNGSFSLGMLTMFNICLKIGVIPKIQFISVDEYDK